MGDPRRPVRQGNPKAGTCRWCGEPKVRSKITKVLFCLKCDAPETEPGVRAGDPTWLKNWRPT